MTVDAALDAGDLADLVRAALAVDPAAVTVAQLPVTIAPGDDSRLAVDETLAPAVVDAFRTGEPTPAGPLEGEPAVAAC